MGNTICLGSALEQLIRPRHYQSYKNTESGEVVGSSSMFFVKDGIGHLALSLKLASVKSQPDGTQLVEFDYRTHTNTFNPSTKEITEEIKEDEWEKIDEDALLEMVIFALSSNQYIMAEVKNLFDKGLIFSNNSSYTSISAREKLWNLATKNQSLFEKLLKTNPNIFKSKNGLSSLDTEQKNINKAMGLPQKVIEQLNAHKRSDFIPYIKTICDDGNDAVIILNFMDSLKSLVKRRRNYDEELGRIFRNLAQAKKYDDGYKANDMLSYLCNQTMFGSTWSLDGMVETSQMFVDYANMREQWGIKERYPSNIFEAHDVTMRNVRGYSSVEEEKFIAVVEPMIPLLEREITIKKGTPDEKTYITIVPKTLKDLIAEGVAMHHCIGTWGRKIINGDTRVVFLRDKETPETSLATLEVDSSNIVIQAKMDYNEDLTPELTNIVKLYERKL